METYLRLKLHGRKSGIIRVTKRAKGMVSGVLVNRAGDEIGCDKGVRNVVVGMETDVVCEMQWNLKYAELEDNYERS